jgi:O-antigen ligase
MFGTHPAVFGCMLAIFAIIGRASEVVPALSAVPIAQLSLLAGLGGLLLAGNSQSLLALPVSRGLAAYVLVAVFSIGWSIWGTASLNFVRDSLLVLFLFHLIIVKSSVDYCISRRYVTTLIVSVVFLAISNLQQDWSGRVGLASSYDVNDLAFVLVVVLPLIIARLAFAQGVARLGYGVATLTVLLTVIITQSRGAFVSLGILTVFLIARDFRRPDGSISVGLAGKVVVIIISAITILLIAPEEAFDRLLTVFDLSEDYNLDTEESGRLAIWTRGLQVFMSRPWGVGVAVFGAAEGGAGGDYMNAHNFLLQALVELGLLGFGILMAMFVMSWRALTRINALSACVLRPQDGTMDSARDSHVALAAELHNYAIALKAAIVAYFSAGFFLSMAYSALFFLLMGLTATVEPLGRRGLQALSAPDADGVDSLNKASGKLAAQATADDRPEQDGHAGGGRAVLR